MSEIELFVKEIQKSKKIRQLFTLKPVVILTFPAKLTKRDSSLTFSPLLSIQDTCVAPDGKLHVRTAERSPTGRENVSPGGNMVISRKFPKAAEKNAL